MCGRVDTDRKLLPSNSPLSLFEKEVFSTTTELNLEFFLNSSCLRDGVQLLFSCAFCTFSVLKPFILFEGNLQYFLLDAVCLYFGWSPAGVQRQSLDKSPVHYRTHTTHSHTHTQRQFRVSNQPHVCFWTAGGN